MKKNWKVWVVDDSEIDNFISKTVLNKSEFAGAVECHKDAAEAIKTLKSSLENQLHLPDLIFLDISMPGMNGYDFLDAFEQLDFGVQTQPVIFMLSSSNDPDDIIRAHKNPLVVKYLIKPLTADMLNEVAAKLAIQK